MWGISSRRSTPCSTPPTRRPACISLPMRESVAVPELATAIGLALGVPARLTAVPVWLLRLGGSLSGRRALVERLAGTLEVDTASLAATTGWRPRYRLAEGLAATAAWWRMRHAI